MIHGRREPYDQSLGLVAYGFRHLDLAFEIGSISKQRPGPFRNRAFCFRIAPCLYCAFTTFPLCVHSCCVARLPKQLHSTATLESCIRRKTLVFTRAKLASRSRSDFRTRCTPRAQQMRYLSRTWKPSPFLHAMLRQGSTLDHSRVCWNVHQGLAWNLPVSSE